MSSGCLGCYAIRQAHRFDPDGALTMRHGNGQLDWTGKVELLPARLDEPLRWKRPRRIFVNSMSDLFHEEVPDAFIAAVFARMDSARQHTFMVLTKRPERMLAIRPWPLPNVWLGVSVEDQATADERIPLLLQTPAERRWISLEPQLEAVDVYKFLGCQNCGWRRRQGGHCGGCGGPWRGLNWVVQGGESGPKSRPFDLAWARSIRDQCKAAGVPWFFKQAGHCAMSMADRITYKGNPSKGWPFGFYRYLNDSHGGDMSEWPEDLRVREFPDVK